MSKVTHCVSLPIDTRYKITGSTEYVEVFINMNVEIPTLNIRDIFVRTQHGNEKASRHMTEAQIAKELEDKNSIIYLRYVQFVREYYEERERNKPKNEITIE